MSAVLGCYDCQRGGTIYVTGQSNGLGRATAASLTLAQQAPTASRLWWADMEPVPADTSAAWMNCATRRIGGYFGVDLGLRWATQRRVLLVARGGTGITSWLAAGNQMYDAVRAQALIAGVVSPITWVWIHGESDSLVEADANAYQGRLTTVVNGVVATYGTPDRFIITGVPLGAGPFTSTVLAAQQAVAAAFAFGRFISTSDLATTDGTHYTAASLITLGQDRIPEQMAA